MKDSRTYLNSQKGKTSEGIKKAILAEIPVIYVVTEEISLVYDILRDDQIIESHFYSSLYQKGEHKQFMNSSKGFLCSSDVEKNVFFSEDEFEEWLSHPTVPVVSVFFMSSEYSHQQVQSLNKLLIKFVQLHQNSRPFSKEVNKTVSKVIKGSTAIVVTPSMPNIPTFLSPFSRVVKVPSIQGEELLRLISGYVRDYDGEQLNGEGFIEDRSYLEKAASYFCGLSQSKIREIFITIKDELGFVHIDISDKSQLSRFVRIIQKEKEQLLESSGILKLVTRAEVDAFGMDMLREWLMQSKEIMLNPGFAKKYADIKPLKGLIVAGIPGSGKSLMAKAVANSFDLPLISMSMGLIMDRHLGDSEHRMAEALRQIEELSPCVVWIDEIEKDMSGTSGGESDGGTARRMFAQFLTWMQEKEKRGVSCFVFATANDISNLPPELFRSGRFDAKFYTFMPSVSGCDDIFNGIIKRSSGFFDSEIDEKFFSNILNEYHKNNSSSNKFLTGSDIESLIELSKKSIFVKRLNGPNSKRDKHIVYKKDEFKEEITKSLESIRSFGETNMSDIVTCFLRLAKLNFVPAGNKLFSTDLLDLSTGKLRQPENYEGLSSYDKNLFDRLAKLIQEQWEIDEDFRKRSMKRN